MLLGVSTTIQRYLAARIPTNVSIAALQQNEPLSLPQGDLLLFLYAVEENPHLRNRGPIPGPNGFVPAPLALQLHYLITFVSDEASDTQEWLSEVLRALSSQQRIGPADLDPALVGKVDHLTVRLRSMPPEEMQKLWTALNVGMRLSLYYDVDAAVIEPLEQTPIQPVKQRNAEFDVLPGVT